LECSAGGSLARDHDKLIGQKLAHIFGAEHVDDRGSIMHEDFGYRTEFDDKNRRIIAKNRLCPFARD